MHRIGGEGLFLEWAPQIVAIMAFKSKILDCEGRGVTLKGTFVKRNGTFYWREGIVFKRGHLKNSSWMISSYDITIYLPIINVFLNNEILLCGR